MDREHTMTHTKESGRSMIEMLGVLAVIGTLSIVAVIVYQTAMVHLWTNQTIDRLTRRAQNVSYALQTGQEADLSDFKPDDGMYLIDTLDTHDSKVFSMIVHNVPSRVCKKLLNFQWQYGWPDKTLSCEGFTDIPFYFLNDLGGALEDYVPEDTVCTGTLCGEICCPEEATCENNQCKCPEETPELFRGKCYAPCREDQRRNVLGQCECQDGYFDTNAGKCVACSDSSANFFTSTQAECHRGSDTEYPRVWKLNKCYLCTSNFIQTKNECNFCGDKRGYYKYTFSTSVTEWCIPIQSCEEGQTFQILEYSNESQSRSGCVQCDTDAFVTTPEQCHMCGNHHLISNHLLRNKTLEESSQIDVTTLPRYCYSCDGIYMTGIIYTISPEECKRCDTDTQKRFTVQLEKGMVYCAWCTGNKIDLGDANLNKQACSQCSNYEMFNDVCWEKCSSTQFRSITGTCYDCNKTNGYTAYKEDCHKCNTTDNKRFWIEGQICNLCTSKNAAKTSKEECDLCSNRTWDSTTGFCSLKTCDSGEFRGTNGSCQSCNTNKTGTTGFSTTQQLCAVCQNNTRFWGTNVSNQNACFTCITNEVVETSEEECNRCLTDRTWKNGKCYKKQCTSQQFRSNDLSCVSCDNENIAFSTQAECQKCASSRIWTTDGKCYKKQCSNRQFRANDLSCVYCSNSQDIVSTQAECQKCTSNTWTANGQTNAEGVPLGVCAK